MSARVIIVKIKGRTDLRRLRHMSHDQNPEQKANEISGSKQTGKLEEDFKYNGKQIDRDIVSVSQIKKLMQSFKGKLPFIFSGKKSQ